MPATSIRFGPSCLILSLVAGLTVCLAADKNGGVTNPSGWRQHDNHRPKPPVVEPAGGSVANPAPKDAVVLFDGTDLGAWQTPEGRPPRWRVKDGVLETVPGTGPIQTKDKFGDVQLHVEWAAPDPPQGSGQDRGNSGVFLMGQFEVQVLDSYKADTYADGQAGAIYGQYPPLFNASRPPGEWQTYDIAFRRPRFDKSGQLLQPARITLIHNGIVVQNNEEPLGPDQLARADALRAGRRSRPDPASGPQPSRPVSATSGCATCPIAPRPRPRTSAARRSSAFPRECLIPWRDSIPRVRSQCEPDQADERRRAPAAHAATSPPSPWSSSPFPPPSSSCRAPTPASPSRKTIRATSRGLCSGLAMRRERSRKSSRSRGAWQPGS